MKAFGIFNLVAWPALGLFILVTLDDLLGACLIIPVGAALVVIDVIWLIVLAMFGLVREQAKLTGQHGPQDKVDVTLVRYLRKARASGIGYDEIERRLRRNGWSASEIEHAHRTLSS